jgi:hypothetical protein
MDPSFPTADGLVTSDLEEASDRVRAVAGRRRRSLAWLVDYLVVMVPGLTLVFFVANYLMTDVYGLGGAVVARAVQWFTHRKTFGLGDAAFNEWVNFALPLVLALLAVPLAQFAYQGIMLAWRGRTIGMMLADVRVETNRTRAPLRRGAAVVRAALTTFVETGLVAAALVLIFIGQFRLGLALWSVAIFIFWADAVPALAKSRRTLIDRMVGAIAVRRGLYAAAARTISTSAVVATKAVSSGATVAAQAVSATATVAGRRAADAAVTAGRAVTDAAAVTGDLVRQGTAALTQTAAVQHVLDSRAVAQAQAIGAAGADRARELGGRAADRARSLGGTARGLWRQRRESRPELPAAPEAAAMIEEAAEPEH